MGLDSASRSPPRLQPLALLAASSSCMHAVALTHTQTPHNTQRFGSNDGNDETTTMKRLLCAGGGGSGSRRLMVLASSSSASSSTSRPAAAALAATRRVSASVPTYPLTGICFPLCYPHCFHDVQSVSGSFEQAPHTLILLSLPPRHRHHTHLQPPSSYHVITTTTSTYHIFVPLDEGSTYLLIPYFPVFPFATLLH